MDNKMAEVEINREKYEVYHILNYDLGHGKEERLTSFSTFAEAYQFCTEDERSDSIDCYIIKLVVALLR